MKTENIINLAVGGVVLFGAVWLVSKAWRTGQGNGQETMSEFRGKRANPRGFAGLNRGVSLSRNGGSTSKALSCEQLVTQSGYLEGCEPDSVSYQCDTDGLGNFHVSQFECDLVAGGVRNLGRRRERQQNRSRV